jgi:hypothetical protein
MHPAVSTRLAVTPADNSQESVPGATSLLASMTWRPVRVVLCGAGERAWHSDAYSAVFEGPGGAIACVGCEVVDESRRGESPDYRLRNVDCDDVDALMWLSEPEHEQSVIDALEMVARETRREVA